MTGCKILTRQERIWTIKRELVWSSERTFILFDFELSDGFIVTRCLLSVCPVSGPWALLQPLIPGARRVPQSGARIGVQPPPGSGWGYPLTLLARTRMGYPTHPYPSQDQDGVPPPPWSGPGLGVRPTRQQTPWIVYIADGWPLAFTQ